MSRSTTTRLRPVPAHERDAAHTAGQGEERVASASSAAGHAAEDAARAGRSVDDGAHVASTVTGVQCAACEARNERLTPARRENRVRIGSVIQRAIRTASYTQHDVAVLLGVADQRFSLMLKGLVPFPSERLLELPAPVLSQVGEQLGAIGDDRRRHHGLSWSDHIRLLVGEFGDVARADPRRPDEVEKELVELVEASQRALADLRARSGGAL